jgi:hypothetical protein
MSYNWLIRSCINSDVVCSAHWSGSVAERSKAMVLSTSPSGGVGSNPTATTLLHFIIHRLNRAILCIFLNMLLKRYIQPKQV